MTRLKDSPRISAHKLILLLRIAKCCQQANVYRGLQNLCEIHGGLNYSILANLIEGSAPLSVVSMVCETEYDRVLTDWFDGADWFQYLEFDPILTKELGSVFTSASIAKLSMFAKSVINIRKLPEPNPAQGTLEL